MTNEIRAESVVEADPSVVEFLGGVDLAAMLTRLLKALLYEQGIGGPHQRAAVVTRSALTATSGKTLQLEVRGKDNKAVWLTLG